MRDHLFISYATEDWPLAEWLTRRLTAEGYRVWCDRFKLLGGEPYPQDIEVAIGERTFRFLALLSRFSKSKDNPVKERTKAQKVGQSLQIPDFVVPLNVDGTEPDWMMTNLTYIPFHRGWASGFRQLLEKLDSVNAPRPLADGRAIAISTFLPTDVVSNSEEQLFSNVLPFTRVPDHILRFSVDPPFGAEERLAADGPWPYYFVSPRELLAFQSPPSTLVAAARLTLTDRVAWHEILYFSGIKTANIVSSLLFKSIRGHTIARGFLPRPDHQSLYLPSGLIADDKLTFKTSYGTSTWIRVSGERTFWRLGVSQKYRYHLALAFRVRRDLLPGFVLQLSPTLYITDPVGQSLPPRTAASRRRRLTRDWWNYEWFHRHLALLSFLANGADLITLGQGDERIELAGSALAFNAPFGINEAALEAPSVSPTVQESDDDGEDEEGEDHDV